MNQLIKYFTVIKRHGFFIWSIGILVLGLLAVFNVFGSNQETSRRY